MSSARPSRSDARSGGGQIGLAELMAALSLAIDVGMAQPIEQGLATCLLAMRLAGALGLGEAELIRVYYLALLRHIGCTAYSRDVVALLGDELTFRAEAAKVDFGRPEGVAFMLRHIGRAHPPLRRPGALALLVTRGPRMFQEETRGACEVARLLAERLGFDLDTRRDLELVYERWDGKGFPGHAKGEALTVPVRVVRLAEDAELFHRLGGREAVLGMLGRRAGRVHDPAFADCFRQEASELLAVLDTDSIWEDVLAAEPGPRPVLSDERLDQALRAMADFADLKSPYTAGHSPGVAELTGSALSGCGLPAEDAAAGRRAALLHDLGRAGVPAATWTKPGPLSRGEWEQVRLHPYHTERVLARSTALRALGALASMHHERLDASGYHRGVPGSLLPFAAQVLAAADAYHAMTEPRAHRPALDPKAAADELRREVHAGRYSGQAVDAVLESAGHRVRRRLSRHVAGLTDRELEVLRLIARGLSTRQVAEALTISPRTADHHIESIYAKIGVSTRAATALFAMQHDLL